LFVFACICHSPFDSDRSIAQHRLTVPLVELHSASSSSTTAHKAVTQSALSDSVMYPVSTISHTVICVDCVTSVFQFEHPVQHTFPAALFPLLCMHRLPSTWECWNLVLSMLGQSCLTSIGTLTNPASLMSLQYIVSPVSCCVGSSSYYTALSVCKSHSALPLTSLRPLPQLHPASTLQSHYTPHTIS
jgi:hypothetical protein